MEIFNNFHFFKYIYFYSKLFTIVEDGGGENKYNLNTQSVTVN